MKQVFLVAGLLGGALLGASRNGLAAQEAAYQSLPVDRDLKAHAVTVGNVVNGLVSLDDHRPQLEAFFQNYLFPEIMEFDAKHVGEIAKRRVRAQSRYIDVIQNSATRDYVNKLTLRYMTKLVANRFHPAVRVNAALMIGSLNTKGPTGARTNGTPPVPMPEAWTFLLKVVELEKFKSGDIPDAVKVASLVGIARHARYELSLEQSQAASKVLLNILTTSKIPPGRTMEGHAWLRRQAIEILAAIGPENQREEIYAAIRGVLQKSDVPLWLQCVAAESLGTLNYAPQNEVDTSGVVTDLSRLAEKVCYQDLNIAQERFKKADIFSPVGLGFGGGFGMNPFGGGFQAEEQEEVENVIFPRNRLYHRLLCVRSGLESILKIQNVERPKLGRAVVAQINTMLAVLEDEESVDADVIATATTVLDQLQKRIRQPETDGNEGDSDIGVPVEEVDELNRTDTTAL